MAAPRRVSSSSDNQYTIGSFHVRCDKLNVRIALVDGKFFSKSISVNYFSGHRVSDEMMYRIRQYVFLLFSLLMSHECTQVSWPSNSSTHDDLECLRDLSVDHLLKIRRALQLMSTKNGHVDSADLLNAHLLPSATINNQLAVYNGVKNNPPVAIPLK